MVGMALRVRQTGAAAYVTGQEKPVVRSLTNGEITLETSVSGEGFNAIDLLYASLSSCLAISARIAARKLTLHQRIKSYEIHVTGHKSAHEPYRILSFDTLFIFDSDLTKDEQLQLAEMAEAMCTVSNTLKASADVHFTTATKSTAA